MKLPIRKPTFYEIEFADNFKLKAEVRRLTEEKVALIKRIKSHQAMLTRILRRAMPKNPRRG